MAGVVAMIESATDKADVMKTVIVRQTVILVFGFSVFIVLIVIIGGFCNDEYEQHT